MKPRNWRHSVAFATAIILTCLYAILALSYGICDTLSPSSLGACLVDPPELWTSASIGDRGSFLAGVFAPLALIWFVAGVWLQQQELRLVRGEYEEMTKANEEQVAAMITAGRTAGREMILNLIEKASEDSKESLENVLPLFEELKSLAKIYGGRGTEEDVEAVLELVSSRMIQFSLMLPIFYRNEKWEHDAITHYKDRPELLYRFTTCARSLAFFVEVTAQRYVRLRELASEADFADVFDTSYAASEERLLFESCKQWASRAVRSGRLLDELLSAEQSPSEA